MFKTLAELAGFVGGRVEGDSSRTISGVATLLSATGKDLSFLSNARYKKHLLTTDAAAVILSEADAKDCPTSALIVSDPYVSYAKIATLLNPEPTFPAQVHASAVVADSAIVSCSAYIGENCVIGDSVIVNDGVVIGAGCVIEAGCSIGENTRLVANVTLCYNVNLGSRCLVHPGVVIGSDGFGIANDQGVWIKVPQLGAVQVGDDVEIGANTTIDRGALDDTVIEDGVKLDNLIQVAHNVRIGAHTVIAGCVGIAGSAEIGKYCGIGGGVGILGHLQIVDGVQVTAMSMVTKSITKPGVYSSGVPLQSSQDWHKNAVRFKHLDELVKRVRELEHVALKQT